MSKEDCFKMISIQIEIIVFEGLKIRLLTSLSREGIVPFRHLSVVAIEKRAFGSPSTKVTKFTYILARELWKRFIYFYFYLLNTVLS